MCDVIVNLISFESEIKQKDYFTLHQVKANQKKKVSSFNFSYHKSVSKFEHVSVSKNVVKWTFIVILTTTSTAVLSSKSFHNNCSFPTHVLAWSSKQARWATLQGYHMAFLKLLYRKWNIWPFGHLFGLFKMQKNIYGLFSLCYFGPFWNCICPIWHYNFWRSWQLCHFYPPPNDYGHVWLIFRTKRVSAFYSSRKIQMTF